jgi:hypothetical protein
VKRSVEVQVVWKYYEYLGLEIRTPWDELALNGIAFPVRRQVRDLIRDRVIEEAHRTDYA